MKNKGGRGSIGRTLGIGVTPILPGKDTDVNARTYAGQGFSNPKSKIQNRELV
jgi:hypothetical protein